MFGYININGKELSEEERKTYQSYYCGLCRRLFAGYRTTGRLLLSYDMTFLIVLLTGLYEPENSSCSFTCPVHPVKKRSMLENEVTEYAAAMNVVLAYHNLEDDWKDDHNLPKHLMAGKIRKNYEQISRQYPRQTKAVEEYIRRLDEAENRKEDNLDLVAGFTGEMLGELFAWRQDEWYHELKTLGFYMGKFIYLMDAYEDLKKDSKKQSYNPLRKLKKESPEDYETICRLMMTSMMSECAKSFERLPIITHAEILRNILYSGVWSRYEYIRLKQKKKDSRAKGKKQQKTEE